MSKKAQKVKEAALNESTENLEIDYANNVYLVKRLFRTYVFPHYKTFFLSIALMIVIAAATAAQAWLVKPALDIIFVEKRVNMLVFIPIVILIISTIRGFATYFQLLTMQLISLRITAKMRNDLYSHFIYSDISTLHRSSSGDMITKIMMEVGRITGALDTAINGFVKQSLSLVFLVGVMFHQSFELALIAFIGFPLAGYPVYKIGKKLRHLSFGEQGANQKFISQMDDTLQYSKLVKAYNCEEFEVNRMAGLIDLMFKLSRKIAKLSLIASPMIEMLGGIGVAAVIWYGGFQVINETTTPGAFFSFFTAMMMAYKPLKAVSKMNSGIQLGLGSAERTFKVLDEKPTIVDKPNALELTDVKGAIKFKDVHFHYVKDKTALNGVNLDIEAGKMVALVGHSGGGKSTIMSMILRFYDPEKGVVSIDGNDITNVTLKSLRRSMSIVNQEVMLFDDSIIENIRYGKENATEAEIIAAAKMAEADEFIKDLPQGYETQVGQNGIRLSGGQRQRIAIARAILYDAPILLLDEATSALDPISENLIKNALRKLMKGRTTLVIAHRLSTVMHADKICVVSNGEIVEHGTHKELLAKNGAYANLYSKQFEIENENDEEEEQESNKSDDQ
ncbi:MAG: ABC transporter ATP-binding protein [Proteobacteria bacterium]|nr:ABC transporter ATP-binding protein [Pseudomonadota bacterium]